MSAFDHCRHSGRRRLSINIPGINLSYPAPLALGAAACLAMLSRPDICFTRVEDVASPLIQGKRRAET
jgi:hypothetical protein